MGNYLHYSPGDPSPLSHLLGQVDTALGLWARLSFQAAITLSASAWPSSTGSLTASVAWGPRQAGTLALVALPDCMTTYGAAGAR